MSVYVRDGRDVMGVSLDRWLTGQCDPPRENMLPMMAAALGVRVPPISVVAVGIEPIAAIVDYGRWCAQCPCGNAEMIWLEGPYQIWCAQCGNAVLAGQHRPVVLPGRAHEIMLALEVRVRPQDRNWRPEQTVEELWAWNDANLDRVVVRGGD